MLAVDPLSWATPAWGLVLPWPSGNSWEAAIKLLLRNWSGNLKDRTIHPLGTLLTHWSPGTRLPTLYVSPVNVYLFKTYSSTPYLSSHRTRPCSPPPGEMVHPHTARLTPHYLPLAGFALCL